MIRKKSIEKESIRSTFELDASERYSDYLQILPSQENSRHQFTNPYQFPDPIAVTQSLKAKKDDNCTTYEVSEKDFSQKLQERQDRGLRISPSALQ